MCIAAMKNMTLAQKAKSALFSRGVSSEIVNLDPMMTKNACAYGIGFSCSKVSEVKQILNQKKIAFGEILGERL